MSLGAIQNKSSAAEAVSYDNSTTSATITSTNVQGAIDELFTSVSNGKSLIASAITDKGVSTSANDSWATMAGNIGKLAVATGFEIININATFLENIQTSRGDQIYEFTYPLDNLDKNATYLLIANGMPNNGNFYTSWIINMLYYDLNENTYGWGLEYRTGNNYCQLQTGSNTKFQISIGRSTNIRVNKSGSNYTIRAGGNSTNWIPESFKAFMLKAPFVNKT